MKLANVPADALITLPEPVRSGRNSNFLPILILQGTPTHTIAQVKAKYTPDFEFITPLDRQGTPVAGLLDVCLKGENKRRDRWRKHPTHGWLQELNPVWTVNGDYPSALAVLEVSAVEDQGLMNTAIAMRFGVELVAMLLGNENPSIRSSILHMITKLLHLAPEVYSHVEIEDDTIKIMI